MNGFVVFWMAQLLSQFWHWTKYKWVTISLEDKNIGCWRRGTWQKMNGKNYGNYNISSDSINKRKLNGKQYGELHHYQFWWWTNKQLGFVPVLGHLESPGILFWHFPGLESPGKRPLPLVGSWNLLNSTEKCEVYGRL